MKAHNFKVTFFAKSEEEAKAKLKEFAKQNPPVVTYEPITEGDEAILTIGKKIAGMIEVLEFASKNAYRMEFLLDLFPKINLNQSKQ